MGEFNSMKWSFGIGFTLWAAVATPAVAADDAAVRFGVRERILHTALSPDGMSMAYVGTSGARGSALYVVSLADPKAKPQPALIATGDPDRLAWCNWISNTRLVCRMFGINKDVILLPFGRLVAVDANGGNVRLLERPATANTRGIMFRDGEVIDWLADDDNNILMTRTVLANDSVGSRAGSNRDGLGVDRVDTTTLAWEAVEKPLRTAAGFISDGHGRVRILQTLELTPEVSVETAAPVFNFGSVLGVRNFLYRRAGQQNWQALSSYNVIDESGFFPAAVDPDKEIAYGYSRTDGRQALHSLALDGSLKQSLVFARPGVDVDSIVQIGRRNRVVGVSFATDRIEIKYLDPELAALQASLSKAIPNQPMVAIVDASRDEQRLLIRAGTDTDAGVYYLYDRAKKSLDTLYVVRPELEGAKLPAVTPVSFPAADGRQVSAYLTLPPGQTMATAKGLKAVVLPDGGPFGRDYWGFDWLAHFLAHQGYAVLRASARGYSGSGDMWFRDNGFQSWQRAVDEVVAAGRWLESQGIAAPGRLGVVGWSHGGYTALQAAATAPSLFKAVVAIAPLTDLARFKQERRDWSNFQVINAEIGSGDHVRTLSPAQNAARITAPVLMFHGTFDRTFDYRQSTAMAARLKAAGVAHEVVTFDKLDHDLHDSSVRTEMLRKIDAFLSASGLR